MFGVFLCNTVICELLDIYENYKQVDARTNINELQQFIRLLSHFCNTQMADQNTVSDQCNHGVQDQKQQIQKKLPKELTLKIEEYFEFHWENNPLAPFQTAKDHNIVH
jgi:hypothetical protein